MKKKMLILLAVSVVVILSTILATIIVRRQPNLHKKEIRDELDGVWSSITMSSNGEIIDNGTKNISETKNSMFSTYDLLGNIIFQYPYVRDGKVAIVTLGNGKECTSNIRITKYGYQFTYKPGYEEYTGMSFPLLDNIYVLQEKDKGRINENLLDYAIIEDGIMELYQYDEKSAIWIGEYHLKDLKQITFDFEQYDIMFQERGFLLEHKEKEIKCEYTRYLDGMWSYIF